ncbi:MAG: protein kinase, partial [Gemmatimonadetes bacterium]|nr:protein kinase [Gemmatimonadota bacterium]
MSSTGTLSAGTLVAERYRIEEVLAGEGSAAVYRAADLRLERAVALRALDPAQGTAARQGKAAARLVHPNVARVLDFGADAALGVEFVVADLGTGGTLAALLAQRGAPPLPLALRMVQEAAAGMAAAHRAGLVHGDLHPGVLWLSRDEGRLRVQVLGLGLTPAGAPPARATARYASPERLRRGRELAPAADVFSLGVVAYEVFAGLPAEWMPLLLSMARGQAVIAPSLREARPDLPAHVAQAVRRALLADPTQRWPDAGELAAHLIAESAAAPAAPATPIAKPAPRAEAPVTAALFATHLAEAAAPTEDDAAVAADTIADAAAEPHPEPVLAAAPIAEPEPAPAPEPVIAMIPVPEATAAAADPVMTASVDVPVPAAPPVDEAAEPARSAAPPAPAPAATRQAPARRAQPITVSRTDLGDSLYIPPALEPRPQPEARPLAAPAPEASPPAAEVVAPAPQPAQAQPVIAEQEPVVPRADSAAAPAPPPTPPVTETVAPVVSTRPVSVAPVPAEATAVVPMPERRRRPGLARLGAQPTGQRRALLAASIAAAVLVGGGVIARTVLAGSGAGPEPRALVAAGLMARPGGTPQQAAVDPAGLPRPVDSPAPAPAVAAEADASLAPEEQARRAEEQKKLEEQRRLQQRQRDSLRQAQQLAAQQAQPAAAQVALAAAPRPAASAPAPAIEQRAAAPATPVTGAGRDAVTP